MMTGLKPALGGALLLAAASTLGDFVWARWIPEHRPLYGLIHGSAIFLVIGGYLGWLARRPGAGALAGALIGFAGAAGFYGLAPSVGYAAMFVMWIALWMLLAIVYAWLRGSETTISSTVLLRGLASALGSGAAFYAISGIWLNPSPSGPNYAVHFLSWTVAYFPGLAGLLLAHTVRHERRTASASS